MNRLAALALALAACTPPPAGPPSRKPADPKAAAFWNRPAQCGLPAYSWIDSQETGTLVAWEEMVNHNLSPATITSLLGAAGYRIARPLTYPTRLYRYRYRTQDRGAETFATGMLGIPDVTAHVPPAFSTMLFVHGTCGFNDKCAPSRDFLQPFLVAALVSAGYVVVAPDYLGMVGLGDPSTQLHPCLVPEPTAIASLDAARAGRALLSGPLHGRVTANPGLLVLGGSQGGHAALMIARFAPYYAPDEEVIAVAASVPPADVVAEAARDSNETVAGSANLAAILAAHADWYRADLSPILMAPYAAQVPAKMREQCSVGALVEGASAVEQVFTEQARAAGAALFVDGSPLSCMVRSSSLPDLPVERLSNPPTLFVLSEMDELVATPLERVAFDKLCAQGLALEYLECAGAKHTEGAVGSFTEQMDFLDARARGDAWAPEKRCQRGAPVVCSGNQPAQ